MNPTTSSNREKGIFEQVLDLPGGAERLQFVKSACGGDAALCARVLALLEAHETDEEFLPEEPKDLAAVVLPVTEKPGDKIGRYRLMEKIGEGGCGIVYVAEQEEPVRRRVALKVIKLGMDTREVVARFEAERQALALMDHPNIARVFVLLYELLAGRPPFDAKQLAEAGLEEMVRCIREQEPLRPSTRLSRLQQEELTTTAQRRGTEPPKLISLLRGDLDWTVMKCLEKNRTRRYEAANALARDVECYLSHEPIVARPPSTGYRVGKFVRRNKVMVAAVGAVAAAMLLGIVGSTWQAVRATRAEGEQSRERRRAEQNELTALAAQAKATQLLKQAQAQAYASDMKAAQVALQQENRSTAVGLLRRYIPKTSEEDLRGLEWRYLWHESQSDERLNFPHPTMVATAVLTPDDRYLATVDYGGTIRVWEVASARKILESKPKGKGNWGTRVTCSADGKWLAASGGNAVEIWDTTNWRVVRELKSVTHPLCFAPDGGFLATTGTNGLWLWDLRNWTHRELTNALPETSSLAFSPDGRRMVSASWRGKLQFWDPQTGIENDTIEVADQQPGSLGISPDGKWLACGSWEGEITLWDLASRKSILRFWAHPVVTALTFCPDGKRLATGGTDQLIHLWESGSSNKVGTLRGHLDEIGSLSWTSDGRNLVSASKDGTAKLWSATIGRAKSQMFTLPTNSIPEGPLPDGRALVALDSKQRLTQVWNLPEGQLIRSFAWSQFEEQGCRAFWHLPANEVVVGQSTNGSVHFWSLRTGGLLSTVHLGATNVERVSLSADKHWLVGTSPAERFTLYDLWTGRRVQHFEDYARGGFWAPSFSPDGRWLAYGTTNYAVRVWDLAANREKATLIGHSLHVATIQFSTDGKLLASGGLDNDVRLWSVETGKPLFPPLKGHQVGVRFSVFSNDGRTLVTGSDNEATRWWSVATGREMLSVKMFKRAWHWAQVAPSAPWDLGGRVLVWEQPRGVIEVTTLSTLAEIDAAEAQRTTASQSR